jgi:hypothetical protein
MKHPPPVKVVKDPGGNGWRLQEPDGSLLPKKYSTKKLADAAARARNAAIHGGRR